MSKIKSIFAVVFALALCGMFAFTGCTTETTEYLLSHYSGEDKDDDGNSLINQNLFYTNQTVQGAPDPAVLDDTANSGYYYLYSTSGNLFIRRSTNLAEWEDVGNAISRTDSEIANITAANIWAPECIYDSETELYYLFFSASPTYDYDAHSGNGAAWYETNYSMYVAVSASPEGPFEIVDFSDSSLGDDAREWNTQTGIQLTQAQVESGDYAWILEEDGNYYQAAYNQYFTKYLLFDPAELSKLVQSMGIGNPISYENDAGYFGTIDPHPWVDPVSGNKYMYFKLENGSCNIIVGVEMMNWLTPDWSTASYCTVNGYYTVEDWQAGQNQGVSYEINMVNEGPYMLYHDGTYYLSFSVNDFGTSSYSVALAVSDSPLGTYRRLTESEGGLLLCSDNLQSQTISGAGHHSFVTVGDQLYIVYHRHEDYLEGGNSRYTAIDEVVWLTVKDKDGNDLTVPYVNGPTDSIQPLPDAISGYTNIADEATVTATDSSCEVSCVNDGYLSVLKTADDTFMSYVRETYITETSTFTFDFGTERTVRAIMIYNSAMEDTAFLNISLIRLYLADGTTRIIRDLEFDVEQYCELGGQYGDSLMYILSGTCVFAEFYDIGVTKIDITVDVPEGQDRVGISEIKILGKAA